MMRFVLAAEQVYTKVRLVSLDVAAAALGGGVLAVRVIGSAPPRSFYWLLPSGVWVVYTIDHLLDARRMGPSARTPRHQFHFENHASMWAAVVIMSLVCGIGGWIGLSWFGLLYAGLMCGLVIAHEIIVHLAGDRASPLLVKELGVALVFTAGVWGMPWLRHRLDSSRWSGWPVVLMLQYFLLAVVNLIEFSIYEWKIDTAHRQTSFVRGIGREHARRIVALLLVVQLPIGLAAAWCYPNRLVWIVEAVYLLMCGGLWLVLLMPQFAARQERYRMIGDGVFLLPLVMAVV
jgi:hypothetical protein